MNIIFDLINLDIEQLDKDLFNFIKQNSFQILNEEKVREKLEIVNNSNIDMLYILDITNDDEIKEITYNDKKYTLLNENKVKCKIKMYEGKANIILNKLKEDLNIYKDNKGSIILGTYDNSSDLMRDLERLKNSGISCYYKKNNEKLFNIILDFKDENKFKISEIVEKYGLSDIEKHGIINSLVAGDIVTIKNRDNQKYIIRKTEKMICYIYKINSNILFEKIHQKYLKKT